MKKRNRYLFLGFLFSVPAAIFGQSVSPVNMPPQAPAYPMVVAYTCIFLPIVSTNSKTTTWNFSNTYSIGLATGINILYSDRFGLSFDLTPVVTTTDGTSKVANLIFDPGAIFRLKKGFALIQQGKKDGGVHELRLLIQRHPQTPEASQARAKLTAMGIHNSSAS